MVLKKIRSSITGTECWDSEKKKIVVVSKGQEPDFEVMEEKGILSDGNTANDFDRDEVTNDHTVEETNELENMTVKELRAYAKKHGIDIPGAIRAKGDILKFIREAE